MKKLRCFALLGLCAASMLAQAGSFEDYARVVSVTERYGATGQMVKVCDGDGGAIGERGVTGALIGAAAGGLLGSTVGKGNGRVAAAAGGAAVGALVGDRMENNNTGGVQRCRMVDSGNQRVVGYTVAYEYQGRTYTENVPFNPGENMRVRVNVAPVRDTGSTIYQ